MLRKAEHVDNRNYAAEAKDLLKQVKGSQLYDLYKIVTDQLKHNISETREKELKAVKKAVETSPFIDISRLNKVVRGYGSSMAEEATPKSGVTKQHKRRV
tara:strand:- start:1200 stop:1499 length:300 start_codon:yes stop_codon:yes gene_type:complete